EVVGITRDERRIKPVDVGRRAGPSFGGERPLDHAPSTATDQIARGVERHRRKPLPRESEVERVDEVRRGVDQGAVEIEDDGEHTDRPSRQRVAVQARRLRRLFPGRPGGTALDTARAIAASKGFLRVTMDVETQKRAAAERALDFVRPGMRLGLGTGSTAAHFVNLLGERVRAGLKIVAVPTSEATRAQAERLGIALTTLDEAPQLDLTVDGADEIAPDLSLIKGGGGALLREKIVASASERMVVIADQSKWVEVLGRFPLPVEIVPFGATVTQRRVEAAAAAAGCPGPAPL